MPELEAFQSDDLKALQNRESEDEFNKRIAGEYMISKNTNIEKHLEQRLQEGFRWDADDPHLRPHLDRGKQQTKELIDRFKKGDPEVSAAISKFETEYNGGKPVHPSLMTKDKINKSTLWEMFIDASQRNANERLTDEENGPEFGSREHKTLQDFSAGERAGRPKFDFDSVKMRK